MQHIAKASAHGRAFAHIAQFHPELTAFRRDLHAHPELGFEEVYTSGRVQQAMALWTRYMRVLAKQVWLLWYMVKPILGIK